MILSIFVYILSILLSTFFCWLAINNKKYRYPLIVLASLIFAILLGIRYEVGVDFPTYFHEYQLAKHNYLSEEFKRWELGFQFLLKIFAYVHAPYYLPFAIIAFLQIFFIFLGTRSFYKIWLFIPFTFITTMHFVPFINGMRNMLAFSLFVFALQFIPKKKYFIYIISILLISLFHTSAILLIVLPIFYIVKKSYFNNRWIELSLLFLALILINIDSTEIIFGNIEGLITLLGYDNYMTSSLTEFNEATSVGMGFFLMMIPNLIIIYYTKQIDKLFSNNRENKSLFNIFYDLYFIGLFIRIAFVRIFMIYRLTYYLFTFEFIIASFLLLFFYKNHSYFKFSLFAFSLLLYFVGYIISIPDNQAIYKTFFYPKLILID